MTVQARIQDFWKGGGVQAQIQDFSQAPPPLGHWTCDVIRPQKIWKTPPLLDIHKRTPLGHCPRDVIRPQKNWKTPPLLNIHKRGGSNFGPNVKKPTSWPKRGGVRTPWTPPPPGSATAVTHGIVAWRNFAVEWRKLGASSEGMLQWSERIWGVEWRNFAVEWTNETVEWRNWGEWSGWICTSGRPYLGDRGN